MVKISVVINTWNEEKNLPKAISSIKNLTDEIVVCDMESSDQTVEVAERLGAKVYKVKYTGYVEPARNYTLSKATGDWVLVLDADEEIPETLAKRLRQIVEEDRVDYVSIPRKNIIFGKWIKHSRWWPDQIIRFFKKGKVSWSSKIHSAPETSGKGTELEAKEENAIIHYNYVSLDQYLERLTRYSQIQAEELVKTGYQFSWLDLIKKPLSEFLSRFFAGEGYRDGVHGLALAFLQAFSEFVVYARIWEMGGLKEQETPEVFEEIEKATGEINYWITVKSKNPLKKILQKIKL